MTDNVKSIRPDIAPETDRDREIISHVKEKLEAIRANGGVPTGIAFVLFQDRPDGTGVTSAHWMTEWVQGPGAFAVAYAGAQLSSAALYD